MFPTRFSEMAARTSQPMHNTEVPPIRRWRAQESLCYLMEGEHFTWL